MKRWLLLFLLIAAALAFVVVPFFFVQPFKPQTPRTLAIGYEVKRLAPWATIALALVGLVLVARMWRASRRWWAKALMVLLLVPLAVSVWASRQNVYESMFNPLTAPAYARAAEADFVGDDEMVLAVERGGERVAYPVLLMAYHHVVADTVGGVSVAATY